jgi:hypothetical protein
VSEHVPEAKSVDEAFAQICREQHPGPACTSRRFRDGCLRLLSEKWRDKL